MKRFKYLLIFLLLPIFLFLLMQKFYSLMDEYFEDIDLECEPKGGDNNSFLDKSKKEDNEVKSPGLSERQRLILKKIDNNGSTMKDILKGEDLSVSVRTLRRDLADMEALGCIEKRGVTRSSKYFPKI